MIMVIKNQIPDFDIHNYSYQTIICPYSIVLKKSNIKIKMSGLCEFFHETQWLFEVFEIPKISGSLILNFRTSGYYKNQIPTVGIAKFLYQIYTKKIFFSQNVLPLSVR
jgi:hypothetical protein